MWPFFYKMLFSIIEESQGMEQTISEQLCIVSMLCLSDARYLIAMHSLETALKVLKNLWAGQRIGHSSRLSIKTPATVTFSNPSATPRDFLIDLGEDLFLVSCFCSDSPCNF